ncbi:hypothetical protein MMC30_001144 [Trapelia coarctata]|nr:hypothetical protein [Trapelia coarctata]
MSSDDAYSAFLDKANQDTGASKASAAGASSKELKTTDTDVPAVLRGVERYYVSEADEPFEAVALKWKGEGVLEEGQFKDLIGYKGEVESLTVKEFDPRGEYRDVLEAVERAGDGGVRVFRVSEGGARRQVWVLGVDGKGGRVVGFRARAVES